MINIHQLPNQRRGEKTELFLRRHWIELVVLALYGILLVGVPILILILTRWIGITPFDHIFWGPVMMSLLSIYAVFVSIILITQYTDYYLDTWIVTTERIINIEQKGLFSRVISELHLNEVQDVTAETHGFFATFLTFGDVFIQTAATRERFNFKNIDNPEKVKRQISKLIQEDKQRRGDAS